MRFLAVHLLGFSHAFFLEVFGSIHLGLLGHVGVLDLLPSGFATLPESGAVGRRMGRMRVRTRAWWMRMWVMTTGAVQSLRFLHAVSLKSLSGIPLSLLGHVRVPDLLHSSVAALPESGAVGRRLGVRRSRMRLMRVGMVFTLQSISFLGTAGLERLSLVHLDSLGGVGGPNLFEAHLAFSEELGAVGGRLGMRVSSVMMRTSVVLQHLVHFFWGTCNEQPWLSSCIQL
jgi:hypothetical protein